MPPTLLVYAHAAIPLPVAGIATVGEHTPCG